MKNEFYFYTDDNKVKVFYRAHNKVKLAVLKTTTEKAPLLFQLLKQSVSVSKIENIETDPEYWDTVFGDEWDRPEGETTEKVFTDSMPMILITESAL